MNLPALDLSIIIVSYNSRKLLEICLKSIYRHVKDITFQVFVVDNDSHDGTIEFIEEHFGNVNLIKNQQNLFFAKANNQAIHKSHGRYILLLNPDTEILDDSLQRVVRAMDHHKYWGAVGCRLTLPSGQLQQTGNRFPSFLFGVFELLFINIIFPGNWVNRHNQYGDWDRQSLRELDAVSGACLFVRREVFDDIGLLDEEFVMYSEEVDLCARIRRGGWKVVYYPDCQIIHHVGGATNPTWELRNLHLNSFLLLFKKHHKIWKYRLLKVLSWINKTVVFVARWRTVWKEIGKKRNIR